MLDRYSIGDYIKEVEQLSEDIEEVVNMIAELEVKMMSADSNSYEATLTANAANHAVNLKYTLRKLRTNLKKVLDTDQQGD